MALYKIMQMRCKVIKALSRDLDEAENLWVKTLLAVVFFVFAYELLLFLIKRNHCYSDS